MFILYEDDDFVGGIIVGMRWYFVKKIIKDWFFVKNRDENYLVMVVKFDLYFYNYDNEFFIELFWYIFFWINR